ncbi:MAG: hypothetical protein ISR78_09485 [Spirochaetia bacterium]|nr:hypothetical protein [Spirochaetia bacterium]
MKKLFGFLVSLFFLIIISPLRSAENVFYTSNSIGMKLNEIVESEINNYEWVVKEISENEIVNETLYSNGTEVWHLESVSKDQSRDIQIVYPDGLVYTGKYRDNLLLHESWEYPDAQIKSVNYQYFSGELLKKTVFDGEFLSETTNYVRKSDGSLHLRNTNYHINNFSEILIIGSTSNISKTALGRKGDFSLIKSYQNGLQITEKWVSGKKITNDREMQTTSSGELVISEKTPEGRNITSYYAENGNLTQQIIENKDSTETILHSYDKNDLLISKTIMTQDSKTVIVYSYNAEGLPETENIYEDGMLIKKITFLETGKREDIYKGGSLYLIITYEEDGQTIKESKLAEE